MNFTEKVVTFDCAGDKLLGMLAVAERPQATGILVVVGGPQTRIGSHRQFLLLSRSLASAGYNVMRFDSRGMGDSTGELRDFEAIGDDISAAIDVFQTEFPQLERIVLWGLCDAASACLMYQWAKCDTRIGGFVLLNPWIRSDATLAKTHIKHYYTERLLQVEFWRKLLKGKLGIVQAIRGYLRSLKAARLGSAGIATNAAAPDFRDQMLDALQACQRPVLLILSGDDYVAKEFLEFASTSGRLSTILRQPNVTRLDIKEADHTFSRAEWRGAVEKATESWIKIVDSPS